MNTMKKRTALGLVTFFSALLSGCSINGLGMVDVQHYENETLHAVEIDAWGGHLSTIQEDAGMTLGHTKRIYLYPKGEGGEENKGVTETKGSRQRGQDKGDKGVRTKWSHRTKGSSLAIKHFCAVQQHSGDSVLLPADSTAAAPKASKPGKGGKRGRYPFSGKLGVSHFTQHSQKDARVLISTRL